MIIPYWLLGKVSLLASGQGSFIYPIPQGQTLNIKDMVFQATGAFSLIGIYDSNGMNYTDATAALGIPSVALANGANNNNSIRLFMPDLVVKGGTQISFVLLDTSAGANTVNLVFNCSRDLPGGN